MMAHDLHPLITTLLPPTGAVRLAKVTIEEASVWLQLTATAPTAACPHGAASSSSIHRCYQRYPTDLPWRAHTVRPQLTVRQCVCRNATGPRRVFTAHLPDLVATSAGHTRRLVTALRAIGLAFGGQARRQRIYRRTAPGRGRGSTPRSEGVTPPLA